MSEELLKDSRNKYTLEQKELDELELIDGKMQYLNFFEDWVMEYTLNNNVTEMLSVYGLTNKDRVRNNEKIK